MVPTSNITPGHSWIPKEEKKRSGWTEITSKHNKRHSNNNKKTHDPFAGMKSCVDYEQEIERLKQLVPKVIDRKSFELSRSNSPDTIHSSRSNSPDTTHSSRSNSPDTAHSSDSELPEPLITEQEKVRFLAFVRSWTGDWKGEFDDHQFMDNSSLWAIQSPWNYCHPTNNQPVQNQHSYNYWQNQQPTINRHGPIGMGRRKN